MSEPVIYIPAALAGEFGISRSRARMDIDLGRVRLNGRLLRPGEHELPMSQCLAKGGACHLERLVSNQTETLDAVSSPGHGRPGAADGTA